MVNFDNAATTFPKPKAVKDAAIAALTLYGGNPGRSGHALSIKTAAAVFRARNTVAEFFGATAENVVFTLNCTYALNLAIKGLLTVGDHAITSDLEHNSVARPLFALSQAVGAGGFCVAHVSTDVEETVANFRRLITPRTKAIICTAASNVTGQILPRKELAALCKEHGLCFILDGAQGCGVMPIQLSDGINILCTSGHKGLYGPTGTGLLITDGSFPLSTIVEGGTGSTSLELAQPDFLPDRFEAGTINTLGAIALGAGIDFVVAKGMQKILVHEEGLCGLFLEGLRSIKGVTIYRKSGASYVPIVSFNVAGISPNELAGALSDGGFALRGGLHCAPLAHKSIGTAPEGTLRFAPSVFNTREQTLALINLIKKICQKP